MLSSAICVRLNQQTHSIPFYQTEPFSFQDLTRHIKVAFKDIPLSSYDIVMDGLYTIYDNQTLQLALKQTATTNTPPDIALLPKSNHTKNNMVPIIKPTVLRWTDNQDNLQKHRYGTSQTLGKRTSMEYQSMTSSQDDGSATRKDSGISMDDEPTTVKKQRVMSADQLAPSSSLSTLTSRKLAYLSPPTRYNTHINIRASSPSSLSKHNNNNNNNNSSTIHPLEMRRPSTAPSSPSYSRRASNHSPTVIKLPALLSITSSASMENNSLHQLPKLAPLQHQPIQRQKYHLPGITSPRPPTILRTSSDGSGPSSLPAHRSEKQQQHEPHSIKYYQHGPSSQQQQQQQKQAGQFLCEQVVNPYSGRICGQTFRRSYDLSRHQTIHLKNRPFCYCDQCGKKFTRMDALRRHERVQGHTSKQHLLQTISPTLQSPGSPSSPSPRPRTQQYPNPSTTQVTPSPSPSHAATFINQPTTTQQTRV